MDLHDSGRFADALPLLADPVLSRGLLAGYAQLYTALSRLALGQHAEARAILSALRAARPPGALALTATVRAAEAASAADDHPAAVALFDEALTMPGANTPALLLGLARAAAASGDAARAGTVYTRIYAEFPASEAAGAAETELSQTSDWDLIGPGSWRARVERERADRLFEARRYQAALAAFELVEPHVGEGDRGLVALRLAACDYHLRRFRAARDRAAPLADRGPLQAESLFYLAGALRELKETGRYTATVDRLVAGHAATPWAEDAINGLATHYILADDDARAAEVFAASYARWPQGRHAERAAWKAGWWAYRNGQWREAVRLFADAAAGFPRSDYRPSWLYWAARSRERLGDAEGARAGFRAVVADYRNTFYGRRAAGLLARAGAAARAAGGASSRAALSPPPVQASPDVSGAARRQEPAGLPENHALIRVLISLELHDLAQQELVAAERSWGQSAASLATQAWVAQALGNRRRGIILLKRAYPSYLTDSPASLPRELLAVLHPLEYWPLIQRYAKAHGLDPYLVAGLINQESTFDAAIRSSAGAIGLMQIMPATGRRYARRLGISRFSTASLTRAETNIRIGTAYLADLLKQFKRPHLALAAYNAGESRVKPWLAERPGLADDEFIDDIPFPETQAYVRRVLGLAEDYREVWGATAATGRETPSLAAALR